MIDVLGVCEATWPAAATRRLGPWAVRDGAGGGKRVSAATAEGAFCEADLPEAEAAMRAMDQTPLFRVRPGEEALDAMLAGNGYGVIDPTNMWLCDMTALTDLALPRVTALTVWEPLAIMPEIWATGGIGPARVAVMHRAKGPKTGLLARIDDHPAGAGFCAISKDTAMVHAIEIVPRFRRRGLAGWMMRAAGFWATTQGATQMSVLCTQANAAGTALYTSLGMRVVGQYHYRILNKG